MHDARLRVYCLGQFSYEKRRTFNTDAQSTISDGGNWECNINCLTPFCEHLSCNYMNSVTDTGIKIAFFLL